MDVKHDSYSNPLARRYAGKEMNYIFSDDYKFKKWRSCWIALAEAQEELGLNIMKEQVEELKGQAKNINFEVIAAKESELRHDVMAALLAYGEQCPLAKPIIHLGATSCFVTGNTELIQYYEALKLARTLLINLIKALSDFAGKYKSLKCLGYTHFQPAQPTTLGKRATLWLQELAINLEDLDYLLANYRIRGIKGATGTQDSFLKLFSGDHDKVKKLNDLVCEKLGFSRSFPVSGQTYPRLWDVRIMDILKNISVSAHKFGVDFRLMQHLKMVDEPFGSKQVGSSAMAYKKNPMRCERICSLSRYVISQGEAADHTAANQWLERSLDDSAGRRLYLPQAFLGVEAVLTLYRNVLAGMKVYPMVIKKLFDSELPFMATETIIMAGVKKGGDRQLLHEAIRQRAVETAGEIKEQGSDNKLLEKLAEDERLPFSLEELREITYKGDFSGRAEKQVEEYLAEYIEPLLAGHSELLGEGREMNL
ncbi:MAG: adenylosuccinate lyase [Spirochaeta sp.]|nr:adenylosuccinate lyase [Spirochaeta sp.]